LFILLHINICVTWCFLMCFLFVFWCVSWRFFYVILVVFWCISWCFLTCFFVFSDVFLDVFLCISWCFLVCFLMFSGVFLCVFWCVSWCFLMCFLMWSYVFLIAKPIQPTKAIKRDLQRRVLGKFEGAPTYKSKSLSSVLNLYIKKWSICSPPHPHMIINSYKINYNNWLHQSLVWLKWKRD